jgi:hypothetical protein
MAMAIAIAIFRSPSASSFQTMTIAMHRQAPRR